MLKSEDHCLAQSLGQSLGQTELLVKARATVASLLARREYSQFELTQKLRTKEYPEDIIEQILNEFTQNNSQSDLRCCHMLLSHGYKSGWGPNKIKQQMQQKGLSDSLISQAFYDTDQNVKHHSSSDNLYILENRPVDFSINQLQQLISNIESKSSSSENWLSQQNMEYNWPQLALDVALKKFGEQVLRDINSKNSLKNKAKLQRFLYNRGFEQEHISFVTRYYCTNITNT